MALGPKSVPPIPRHELIATALQLGISRPESMTETELTHCIQQVSEGRGGELPHTRGWMAVARNLVASVVEQGLNMPSAARVLRDGVRSVPPQPHRPPLPTLTLARIYLAQGHTERAIATLKQVLGLNPGNARAAEMLAELEAQSRPESGVEQVTERGVADEQSSEAPSVQPQGLQAEASRAADEDQPTEASGAPEPASASASGSSVLDQPDDRARSSEPPPSSRSPQSAQLDLNWIAGAAVASAATVATEADWVVVVRSGPDVVVYWELGARGQRALERGDLLRIRTLSCSPSPRGAEVQEEQHVIAEPSGCVTLSRGPEVVVRAALGIERAASEAGASGGWVPLCVASSHRVVEGSERLSVDYRPRKHQLDSDVVARARQRVLG